MHSVFNRNIYLIKDNPRLLKPSKDIYDHISNNIIMECREINHGLLRGMLRATHLKVTTPFKFMVRTPKYEKLLVVSKSLSLFQPKITVLNENEKLIGRFSHDLLFKLGGAFDILATHNKLLCQLKGNWLRWSFGFIADGIELAKITNKWRVDDKVLSTNTDGYILQISDTLSKDNSVRQLILAATLYIDMFLKV